MTHALRGRTRYPGLVSFSQPPGLHFKGYVPTAFNTATNFSVVVPTYVVAGDLLVISLFARAALTSPAGWLLVSSVLSGVQTAYMYYKIAVSGDAGSTVLFSQASSQRYGIGLIVVSTNSFSATPESSNINTSTTMPAVNSLKSNNIAIGLVSIYSMGSGSAYIYENGWTPLALTADASLRLCMSFRHVNMGSVPSWTFYNGITALTVSSICAVFTI